MVADTGAEVRAYRDRARGCLLGGIAGDMAHGECGQGRVSSDTQLMLWGMEGMIRYWIRASERGAHAPSMVALAYRRWAFTQTCGGPGVLDDEARLAAALSWVPDSREEVVTGALVRDRWMYERRSPGNAALTGIMAYRPEGTGGPRVNPDAKGRNAVLRSAPFGVWAPRGPGQAFELARLLAEITHGHPTAPLAAGAFAVILQQLCAGASLDDAVMEALSRLSKHPGHEETTQAIRTLGNGGVGGGTAERALALGLRHAVLARQSGDFTGALKEAGGGAMVCGHLLGAMYGESGWPPAPLVFIERRDLVLPLVDDFLAVALRGDGLMITQFDVDPRLRERYEGTPTGH